MEIKESGGNRATTLTAHFRAPSGRPRAGQALEYPCNSRALRSPNWVSEWAWCAHASEATLRAAIMAAPICFAERGGGTQRAELMRRHGVPGAGLPGAQTALLSELGPGLPRALSHQIRGKPLDREYRVPKVRAIDRGFRHLVPVTRNELLREAAQGDVPSPWHASCGARAMGSPLLYAVGIGLTFGSA